MAKECMPADKVGLGLYLSLDVHAVMMSQTLTNFITDMNEQNNYLHQGWKNLGFLEKTFVGF